MLVWSEGDFAFDWDRSYARHWRYDALEILIAEERVTVLLPRNNRQRGAVIHCLAELDMKIVEHHPRTR